MILELFNEYRVPAQHISSLLLAAAIWRWGAGPERWLIGVFIATMVVPVYLFRLMGLGHVNFGPHAWMVTSLDLLAMLAFAVIAVNANRNYPLWIAGLQLVAIGAYAAKGLVDSISPLAFLLLSVGPSYAQLLLILAGFLRHVQRQRRHGAYRDWRILHGRLAPFQT